MHLNGVLLRFLAVSTIECNSEMHLPQNQNGMYRSFFNLIFNLRIPRSTSLLSGWYSIGYFKEIEDVVTAFYQTLFECFKLLTKIADIQFEKVV